MENEKAIVGGLDGSIDPSHAVTGEVAGARVKICQACPELGADMLCAQCGCPMNVKTWFDYAECPLGKWGPHAV